jgi:hypothetical protein
MVPKLTSYEEFWPYYLSEHMQPATRRLHFAGTSLVLAALLAGVLLDAWWLLAMPLFGYGFAWAGHFFVEHNRPATFTYPLWSLRADFRMFRMTLQGRLGPELERARRTYPPAAAVAAGHSAASNQ